ncbi:MAG: hypothetical protein IT178_19275 [Acidobacteria bacterium]|nr:hypothetical protein [Acidobacteriota bacterium]
MSENTPARRGRPPKYGRPAQLLTLTLPDDVVAWLKTLHTDPAWAIVKLAERASRRARKPAPLAELVPLPERRALIMVNAEALRQLPGVAVIPLADGRGFLALEPGKGVADLELAVIDRLDAPGVPAGERQVVQALRDRLREWRQQGVRFESRAIIVASRGPGAETRAARSPAKAPVQRHAV